MGHLVSFFTALLLTFLPICDAFSQGDYWGLKAGLNVVKVSKVDITNSIRPGFHFGFFANFRVSDRFSSQHEVLFSTKGVSLSLPDSLKPSNNNQGKYSRSFNYIDIPWILNYHYSDAFYISAGVQPSIYAHFKHPKFDPVEYNKDNVNTIDVSAILGAGFIFKNNWGFGARFNMGLVHTFDTGNKGKNYLMQIYASYAVNRNSRRGFKR
jgi:hypothetical protein